MFKFAIIDAKISRFTVFAKSSCACQDLMDGECSHTLQFFEECQNIDCSECMDCVSGKETEEWCNTTVSSDKCSLCGIDECTNEICDSKENSSECLLCDQELQTDIKCHTEDNSTCCSDSQVCSYDQPIQSTSHHKALCVKENIPYNGHVHCNENQRTEKRISHNVNHASQLSQNDEFPLNESISLHHGGDLHVSANLKPCNQLDPEVCVSKRVSAVRTFQTENESFPTESSSTCDFIPESNDSYWKNSCSGAFEDSSMSHSENKSSFQCQSPNVQGIELTVCGSQCRNSGFAKCQRKKSPAKMKRPSKVLERNGDSDSSV